MSPMSRFRSLRNGDAVDASTIPVVAIGDFRASILRAAQAGNRLCALVATGDLATGGAGLLAVVASDASSQLWLVASEPVDRYPALTPDLPAAHLFEREIHESAGILPEGHPWLKSVRRSLPDAVTFYREEGEEVHEVAVGPIHAGIIEPGHFRFQCQGETVHHLEIQLGYQHRGVERLLKGGPDRRSLSVAESICGDTAVGHALAHCMIRESLAAAPVTLRSAALRGAALEMERLSNHIGDLGAMSNDVGYLPAAAYFGRLRGTFLNMLMTFSGNRYGRGLAQPGGIAFDLDPAMGGAFLAILKEAAVDLDTIGRLFFGEPSVIARLEETGRCSRRTCEELGVVGLAARAAGIDRDVRQDHPHGVYRFKYVPVIKLDTGDVYARAMVRWLEARRSIEFLTDLMSHPPTDGITAGCAAPRPGYLAVALVEGWRGEILHIARTGASGTFDWYKVVDPSFHNWMGLAMAMRNGEISDFPLCNKSFNLSYAGHDL